MSLLVCHTHLWLSGRLFLAPAHTLFLSRLSPSGTFQKLPATDCDGNPRPTGRGTDMSAYEHQP